MTAQEQAIDKIASILQEWSMEATYRMQDNLKKRLKHNSQASQLSQSLTFEGSEVKKDSTTVEWSINDYYIYIDLGVKGTQNKSKFYGNFAFKNNHVSKGFIKSLESYITRKGIKVRMSKAESKLSVLERRKQTAFQMAKAIKKKGISGTKFYSDVFNDKEFKKLADKITDSIGGSYEINISSGFKL